MKSTISSKGQITVPAAVRERLGLVPGTAVAFELRGDGVLLRKRALGTHPVDQVFGLIRAARPADALARQDETRGRRAGGRGSRRRR
jgi:AbrB family looped-hinge helix DNA binding protein